MSSWKTISRASGLTAVLVAALAGAATSGATLAQDPIEVEQLGALDPLEVNLRGAALGNVIWHGSGRDTAAAVLHTLPDPESGAYASPAVADLARQILMSGGQPPAGGRGDDALATLRAERLLAAAGPYDAFDLLDRTPRLYDMNGLGALHTELGFAIGEDERACQTANAMMVGRDEAFWLRARAFCLALEGQDAAAELTAELARGESADVDYDTLLYAITLGQVPDADDITPDSGLDWGMARTVAPDLAADGAFDVQAPAWLQRYIAGSQQAPAGAVENPAALLDEARAAGAEARREMLRALTAQSADRDIAGVALGLMLADAAEAGTFIETAREYGREIGSVPVSAATLDHGYELAMAALLTGNLSLAERWRNALIDGPPKPEPQPVAVVETPEGLATPVVPDPVEPVGPVWEPPSPRRMVALDLALAIASDRMSGGGFEAVIAAWDESQGADILADRLALDRLGVAAPASLRTLLLEQGDATATPLASAMELAARAGARGEAALLAVSILNDESFAASPDLFARAIDTLDAVGLRRHALAIMTERVVERAM